MWLFILKWWRELLIALLAVLLGLTLVITIAMIKTLKAEKETLETEKAVLIENVSKCMAELGFSGKETSAVQEELVKCRKECSSCPGQASDLIKNCDAECAAYVKKLRDHYEKLLDDCYKSSTGGGNPDATCSDIIYSNIRPYLYTE